MDTLKQVVEKEMREYASEGLRGTTYFTHSDDHSIMIIVYIGKVRDRRFATTSIMARIVGNQVVIEEDKTNKPLVDALVQAGIPREQIILAYEGESFQETA
jgi:hypothetical protein